MKRVKFSTKAKKDLKKYRDDSLKTEALFAVLHSLALGETLPKSYRPHYLLGEYKGCMECHIGSDFLLIWLDEDFIEVVRVGSHSELFK